MFYAFCEKRKCIMSDLDSDGFTHVEKNQVIGEENLEGREKRSEEKSFIM